MDVPFRSDFLIIEIVFLLHLEIRRLHEETLRRHQGRSKGVEHPGTSTIYWHPPKQIAQVVHFYSPSPVPRGVAAGQ